MAKRVSARAIKSNWQYTYEEAASALGVTPQTVRSWRAQGLVVLASQKPHIILGFALKEFLGNRAATSKRSLAPDQFLCMSCDAPRSAYGSMADYIPLSRSRGRLLALCAVCGTECVRFSSPAKVASLAEQLAIVTRSEKQA